MPARLRKLVVVTTLVLLVVGFSAPGAAGSRATTSASQLVWSWRQPVYTTSPCCSDVNVATIARDPLRPSTIYAGADDYGGGWLGNAAPSGGIYRTQDAGVSWQFLARPSTNQNIINILVHPITTTLLFAAYGVTGSYVGGIYRSPDGGTTWSNVLPSVEISDVVFDPTNPSTLYAAGGPPSQPVGIYRSTDMGQTWPRISNQAVSHFAVSLATPSVLYAVTFEGGQILSSTDAGVSWTSQPSPPGAAWDSFSQVLINPQNAQRMYYFGSPYKGIWTTADGGLTWTDTTTNLPDYGFGRTVISAAFDPTDPNTLWVGLRYAGPFESTDGGSTWIDQTAGIYILPLGDDCPSFALATSGEHAVVCEGFFYTREPMYFTFLPSMQAP